VWTVGTIDITIRRLVCMFYVCFQYDIAFLVPKKGLEPPHPCEYVDLNHARLPIPPLRHCTQVQRYALNRQQF